MAAHEKITGPTAIHPSMFIQSTDPALVGTNNVLANKFWLDTTNNRQILKYRDPTNAFWMPASYHSFCVPISDETTAITNGTKCTFRMDGAFRLYMVRAGLTIVSSSGLPTFDILKNASTIFATKITVDATEKTSVTAATAYSFLAAAPYIDFADDDEVSIAVTTAGTGAAGAKIWFIGLRI